MLRLTLSAMLGLLLPLLAHGQDTASLAGTVQDQQGALIPRAHVTLQSASTGYVRNLVTNGAGEYLAPAIPPGRYTITVTADGFRRYRAEGVTLRVSQSARIDVRLEVGAASSEVVVEGEGLARVETQSSELGGTITGKEITQLQLNGRNFTQLITLMPGVSNQTGQDEGEVGVSGNVNFSVNGGRVENNNWEVDGGDTMDNGSNETLNVYPSVDALEEVTVQTSNFGAQYGRNASGMIEAETKSGTNQFHGDVYEFFRNEALNAHNYFDPPDTRKPQYRKNDLGYTLGGPVWKNHTYFFWSEEWRRENVPQNFDALVPSVANRQGDFSDQCNVDSPTDCPYDPNTGDPFPNNQIPGIDPSGAALLSMIPLPTAGSGADSIFIGTSPQPTHWREELVRLDHDINPRWRATLRYIHDEWDTINATVTYAGYAFPTINSHYTGPGESAVAKLTATFSPTMLNELLASYTTDHLQIVNTNPAVWTRTDSFTMPGLFPDNKGQLPDVCLSTSGAYGGGFCEGPSAYPWSNSNPTYTLRDNLTKKAGRHDLEMGGYFVTAQKNEYSFTDVSGDLGFDTTAPVSTGNALADMLLGNVAYFSQDSAQPKYHLHYDVFEPFVQDDLRLTQRLTLNLGVRVSFLGTFYELNRQVYNWDPAAFNPANASGIDLYGDVTGQEGALIPGSGDPYNGQVQCGAPGVPRGCERGHLVNPAPRVGFSWDPTGQGRMAVRGAYGIFFDHTNGEEANAENLEGSPPLVQEPTQFDVTGYNNVGGQGLLFPLSTISIPTQVHWPYVQQWHLDLQRELAKDTVATVSYVGSRGTHLTLIHELNQLAPVASSANPFLPGQPITDEVCNSWDGTVETPTFTVNGKAVTGPPAINLAVACGNDPNPYRPYYGISSTEGVTPSAYSSYNAFQLSLRKTNDPLTLNVAYTYSHSLDNSSDKFDGNFVDSFHTNGNYASSNFDQRHILTVAWIYNLPSFRGRGLNRTLFGGWQYAGIFGAQSGVPFSVLDGVYGDSAGVANGVGTGTYADRVGNPHGAHGGNYSDDPAIKGPQLFDVDAFAEAQGLTFGSSGRNSLNIPFRSNFDMSVYKTFEPERQLHAQFRLEAFNVFNHTEWNGVNNSIGTDYFLRPSGAHAARIVQVALKLLF